MKRQPMEWKEIFANPIADKELISKIYKQFIHMIQKQRKTSKPNQKIGRRP